ncbi:MAG: prepilin-type N-terminal cleavage/methylation domain-containing protein [Phycisphaerales bacterium]
MQASRKTNRPAPRGFSLIELVIVVVIIGIIGAIAVPRMSRGAKGASDSAVTANLTVLRNALDLYATEHGGSFPTFANMPNALLQYTDSAGDAQAAKDSTHIYGPYIRAIPKLPVGANKGLATFTATAPTATAAAAGWYYNDSTGAIQANCKDAEVDEAAVKYNAY